MLRIFNKTLNANIVIEKSNNILVIPKTYEDKPNFRIEFRCGFNFGFHTHSCRDCKLFLDAFGTQTNDWFIEYNDVIYLIDTYEMDGLNNGFFLKYSIDSFINGSILQFNVMHLDIYDLKLKKGIAVGNEEYEVACFYRDLIDYIGNINE